MKPAVRAKVHVFEDDTTSEVYDQTQYRDDIEFGDVLVVPHEKVVGFLLSAWPVAVTKAHGALHSRAENGLWSNVIRDERRTSGPVTDVEAATDVGPHELDLVKDVIAIVNRVTGNKEDWYVKLPDGSVVVPVVPPVNR